MKKGTLFIVLGLIIGVALGGSTPVLATRFAAKLAPKTTMLKTVFNRVKSVKSDVGEVQKDVDALQMTVNDSNTDIDAIAIDVDTTNATLAGLATSSSISTLSTNMSTASDKVIYNSRLVEDIYDNAYYQSLLLNNIAVNTYFACIYSGIDPDSCYTPINDLIDTADLFNYEISSTGIGSSNTRSIQNSSPRSMTSDNGGNAGELRNMLEGL